MTYAMLYAENADIIGTYKSMDEAMAELAQFVSDHPDLQDDVGLRPYAGGRPVAEFRSATDLLGNRLAQQQFVDAV
jgi:hypothetical protein